MVKISVKSASCVPEVLEKILDTRDGWELPTSRANSKATSTDLFLSFSTRPILVVQHIIAVIVRRLKRLRHTIKDPSSLYMNKMQ